MVGTAVAGKAVGWGTAVFVGAGVSVGMGVLVGKGVLVGGSGVEVGTAVLVAGGGSGVFVGSNTSGVQVGGIWAMACAVAVLGGTVASTARVGNVSVVWQAANEKSKSSNTSHIHRLVD
jgi:hypothetical protein